MTEENKVNALEKKIALLEANQEAQINVTRQMFHGVNQNSDEDEIDLRQLFSVIWKGKFKIMGIALIFVVVSVFYALSLPNIYTSTLKLVPAQQESEGGLSSLASKYGGLASMAGINLGGGSGNNIEHAIELMNSWPYIEGFVEKHGLKTTFMAANGWDASTNQLKFDIDKFDKGKNQWKQVSGLFSSNLKSLEPTSFETYKAIKKDFFLLVLMMNLVFLIYQ
ncbi:Wzz/FepE/Etk N-terminal domain-containing protein [Psychrosphaera haliotis]|uniref:Polysaccharide chain length determinant N-terminal domain-containing protein n=1 Tax=Psychrosphaera haliotis TaxID=555083 RepID=A0A6N8F4Z7_9GAMM|nr:Wzz/FepE/Etk N-terminal domain-containing protein [Psychrosphaera haliotis]MUH71353.1 hypothetical protein [Psychrosphaera haliotis]